MAYQITEVHVENPKSQEQHISKVKLSDGKIETREQVYNYIKNYNMEYYYYTVGGGRRARVMAQISSEGTHYIRTHPDDTTADNLLELPKF